MFLTFGLLAALVSTPAHAETCYDVQVCEEVCTEVYLEPVDGELELSRTAGGFQPFELPQSCETVCTFEEYCLPEGAGEGTYDIDPIDACYAEQLLVDQIRCIQALQG